MLSSFKYAHKTEICIAVLIERQVVNLNLLFLYIKQMDRSIFHCAFSEYV